MKCYTKPYNPCPQGVINTKCIVYTGTNLTNINVYTNDRLDVILTEINNYLGSLSFDLFTEDTDSIDLEGDGTSSDPLTANLKISSVPNNIITLLADGAYVPGSQDEDFIVGGEVAWTGTGLIFDVTEAVYTIDGVEYNSPYTTVTLDPADPSDDRIDVFYVDINGDVGVLTGIAEPNPVKPQVDTATQIELTSVYIPAGSLIPLIVTEKIYDENVEWTTSQVGTTVNFGDTSTPQLGTVDADVTNISNGDYLLFTKSGTVDIAQYDSVILYLRLKAAIPSSADLKVSFQNSAGLQLTTEIVLPINKSNTSSYQAVEVPISYFSASNSSVTKFRIRYYDPIIATDHLGFYVDNIYLQKGILPSISPFLYTASNGLTLFGTDFQLGGILHKNTSISTASYQLTLAGATTPSSTFNFNVVNSTGSAIKGQTTTGTGVQGSSAGANGYGVFGSNTVGPAGGFLFSNSSGSTAATVLSVQKATSGTPAAGMGANISFFLSGTLTPSIANLPSNRIVSTWTNATTLSQTSQLVFTGTNAAVESDLLTLSGNGQARLNKYGINTFTGTMVKYLAVTSNGTVIESDPGAGGEVISADNGLTENIPGNVQLGGSLLQNTTITSANASFRLNLSGINTNATGALLNVTTTGSTGTAVLGTSTTGNGIAGITTSGPAGVQGGGDTGDGVLGTTNSGRALAGTSGSGTGLYVTSNTGKGAQINVLPSSTNTRVTVAQLTRYSTGTPVASMAGSLDFTMGTSTNGTSDTLSNRITSLWTDATTGTRTSQLIIAGVSNTITADLFTLSGSGALQLNKYGINTFAGTPAYAAGWDASGNFVEFAVPISGGTYTASNGLTMTANDTALGGTLLANTGIATGAFTLALTTSTALSTPFTSTATTGNAVTGTATTGIAIAGSSQGASNATGQFQNSGGGIAGRFIGNGTTVLWTETNAASVDTVIRTILFDRKTSGTAAAGIGNSIEIGNEKSDGNTATSTQLISKWTNATNTTETSQFILTGVNTAVTADLLTISGSGAHRFNKYGIGTFTGTAATYAAFDSSGNIIELNSIGTAPVVTADNGLNKSTATNVQMGGVFLQNTSLGDIAQNFGLTVSRLGTSASPTISAVSNTGVGINCTSTSGNALISTSNSGLAGVFTINPSSTNTLDEVIRVARISSGSAANGLGGSINFTNEVSDNSQQVSARIGSTWTDVTLGTRTGDLQFFTTDSASSAIKMTLAGNGAVTLHGTPYTGLGAGYLAVSNTGVLSWDAGTGGAAGVTSVTGTTNRITSSGGATPAIDIAATYVGQTSITTLGTLTTGATGAGFTVALATSTITGQLALANGGTGANLTDPGADRILFWDDSAGAATWLTLGTNLSITGTTINAAGGGGAYTETETSVTSDTTPNPTGDSRFNYYDITALAGGATFAAPSGTPANHNRLTIRILDDGTARSLGWNAIYRGGSTVTLPTTTVVNLTMHVDFIYNSADSTWDCIGVAEGY